MYVCRNNEGEVHSFSKVITYYVITLNNLFLCFKKFFETKKF